MRHSPSQLSDLIIQGALVLAIGLAAVVSGPAAASYGQEKTAPAVKADVPKDIVGEWVEGSVSPTTYWNTQTGQFMGNARGMGQYLIMGADGTFKRYVYIEMRMYNMVTQVWTQYEGTVEYGDGSFTFVPTKGHYKTAGTSNIDRDMTEGELKEKRETYKWQIEEKDGKPVLVLPFDDGSRFELRQAEASKKE